MPLILASPLSRIHTTYFSHNGLSTGDWMHVEWRNWSRLRKLKTVTRASDGSSTTYMVGLGTKGPMILFAPSMPTVVYQGLRTLADSASRYVFAPQHAYVGSPTYDVDVISVLAEGDGQYITGDPIENVTIVLESHGAAA